jgi:subtilisin family serine protease
MRIIVFKYIKLISFFILLVPAWAQATEKMINLNHRFAIQKTNEEMKSKGFVKIFDTKNHSSRLFRGDILIQFKVGSSLSEHERYFLENDLKVKEEIHKGLYRCIRKLAYADSASPEKALMLLNNFYDKDSELTSEIVEKIDINEYKRLGFLDLESNPDAFRQWYLKNDGINGFIKGADINIEEAWDYTKGEGIKVAVIDTGFDLRHSDINYAGPGYDALNDSNCAGVEKFSDEKHGTAVAGVISAKDNNKGTVGVAPNAKIIPIRLISDSGLVSVSNIVKAFRKADEMGASIINNSWGTFNPNLKEGDVLEVSDIEKELYQDLAKNGNNGKGILILFAAGNSGRSNFHNSPEARMDCVVAVGATDSRDLRASYSVHGRELDLVAPGGGIKPMITTDRLDIKKKSDNRLVIKGYSKGAIAEGFRGTSAAAPVVAGVAALVWSLNPNFTAEEVREILIESAKKDINERYKFDSNGKNLELGYGRVDAGEAVKQALQRL